MSETSVKGREVLLKRPPMTIFSLFSDLSLLVQNVPEEYGGRIQADKDSVHIEYKGIKFGIVVDRREPFSLVVLKDEYRAYGRTQLHDEDDDRQQVAGDGGQHYRPDREGHQQFGSRSECGFLRHQAAGQFQLTAADFPDAAGTVYSTAYTLPRS